MPFRDSHISKRRAHLSTIATRKTSACRPCIEYAMSTTNGVYYDTWPYVQPPLLLFVPPLIIDSPLSCYVFIHTAVRHSVRITFIFPLLCQISRGQEPSLGGVEFKRLIRSSGIALTPSGIAQLRHKCEDASGQVRILRRAASHRMIRFGL